MSTQESNQDSDQEHDQENAQENNLAAPILDEADSGPIYAVFLFVVLTAVWLGWSGYFNALMLTFAVFSIGLSVFLSTRLKVVDAEGQHLNLNLLGYLPWLLKEIVLANVDVIKRILSPNLPISPTWVKVEATQKSRFYRVLFANSITLTPGTVSILLDDNSILVHAVSQEGAESLLHEGGDMGRKVTSVEPN